MAVKHAIIGLLLCGLLFGGPLFGGLVTGPAAADSRSVASSKDPREAVVGRWMTEGGRAIVEIEPCTAGSESLCGRIVWTWKRPEVMGHQVLSGFEWDGEHWTGGRLFEPNATRGYRGRLELTDEVYLKVKGCLFLICRGETWFRPGIAAPGTPEAPVPETRTPETAIDQR
ncbi:MAG: DUF2147 domain-containing protein [Alphaproteobacteria bacterium]